MSDEQLLADLRATFPGIDARPLREFGTEWRNRPGVWTGGDSISMPDGLPIFSSMHCDDPHYNGYVHDGFEAWLQARGWYVETYDGGTFLILSLVELEEYQGQMREAGW
jgi:hypothetical protein